MGPNQPFVSDLARRILKKSVGDAQDQHVRCGACRRTPVPGEFVHRVAPEQVVCSLCLAKVPVAKRDVAVPERVHAGERHISVLPRAA